MKANLLGAVCAGALLALGSGLNRHDSAAARGGINLESVAGGGKQRASTPERRFLSHFSVMQFATAARAFRTITSGS
jgi:hypothetical protein